MAEVVNRTSEVATNWQQHIVWIRVNIGFIKAELVHVSSQGHDISGIQALLHSFESAFEQFCRCELEVFVAARLSETSESGTTAMVDPLLHMRNSFLSWLDEYNDLVEETERAADSGLPLVLLRSCGGELLASHARFVDSVDSYVGEIKRPLS